MHPKEGFTYIMSNKGRNVFYTSVTDSIGRRSLEHFLGIGGTF